MLIIGLTGGIGSGKSTVTQYFKQHNIPIIDADVIALELVNSQPAVREMIIQHFGKTILKDSQQINRSELRKIIFANPTERKWLESLLHPLIKREITTRLNEISAPYCIVVIPLLNKKEDFDYLHRILVIDIPEDLQVERTTLRDQASEQEIKNIMLTQLSRKDRLKLADDVITNYGDFPKLKEQVDLLHEKYLKLS